MDELAQRIAELSPEKRALLERRVRDRQHADAISTPSIQRRGAHIAPLSFAQEQLWFLHQLEPASPFYNTSRAWRIQGPLNSVALERSLSALVERHEILRTTFTVLDDLPLQTIAPTAALPVRRVDLRGLLSSEREREALHLLESEGRRPFVLQHEFPLRVLLLTLDQSEYILLLTIHHIAFDGWSLEVFWRDLGTLYTAFARGEKPELSPLPLQYADFALWQREHLQGETLEHLLRYWRDHLQGAPEQVLLPTDYARPRKQTFRGKRCVIRLPATQLHALKLFCRQEGVTLFTALFTAFQVLLYRYSGQSDLVIGTNVANRFPPGCEPLIGLFTNMLALRADLSERPAFRELVQRTRKLVAGALAHQELPFEKLVEDMRPQRTLQYMPLFQIVFVQQPPQNASLTVADLHLVPLIVDTGAAPFDLVVSAEELAEELLLTAHYSTDLFAEQSIAQLLGCFQTILEGLVAEPDRSIDESVLLTSAQSQQLLLEWSSSGNAPDETPSVVQLFEQQVRCTPDAIAIVAGDIQISYAELERRANQLAHALLRLGISLECCVGLCFQRVPELVIALLGTLKAGGAYVPLDPGYPAERLEFMLKDSQARVLLTQACLCSLFSMCEIPQLLLDRDWSVLAQEKASPPEVSAAPACAAYVIYTSGSTGQPKGVLVSRQALAHFIQAATSVYGLDANTRQIQLVSPGFDVLGEELFLPLCAGGAVVLGYDPGEQSALDLMRIVEREGASKMNLPASYWHQLVDELVEQRQSPPDCLRLLTTGAESPALEKLLLWQELVHHQIKLFNVYGPTEATIITTTYDIPPDDEQIARATRIPIGWPLPGWQVYLLDAHLQPVPIGLPGELYIGGAGLARGYVRRPDITAERFIPHPWSTEPGARLYRTGDLARYLPDGKLVFVGRVDHQVKVRGFRIELQEIEVALGKHPALKGALVLFHESASGQHQLCGYIVPVSPAHIPRPAELRRFLRDLLPAYMMPARFVALEAFPLSPNGKLNRKALPDPARHALREEIDYVAPREAVEQVLAGIWAQLLGGARVGIHDNFFELGGDSITSLQVVARAGQAGIHLQPRQLFEHQTIAELASVAVYSTEQPSQVSPSPNGRRFSLTPIQSWFFEQGLPNPHHWNQALLLELPQEIDQVRLEEALTYLVRYHSALRLRFLQEEGIWRQHVADSSERVAILRLEALPETEEARTSAIEQAFTAVQASLNLTHGPLLRAALIPATPAMVGRLLLVIHHLAVDRVSWNILLDDLQSVYTQLSQGKPPWLAPATDFLAWAEALQQAVHSERFRQERTYWLAASRAHIPQIPLDYNRDTAEVNTMAHARTVEVVLDEQDTRMLLRQVHGRLRVRVDEFLLAALVETFAYWTGEDSLLVDIEVHGRETLRANLDLSRAVGWFTAQFPLLLKMPGAFARRNPPEQNAQEEVLLAIQEQRRQVPGSGIGYGVLRYLSNDEEIQTALCHAPSAQIGLNYLGQMDAIGSEISTLFKVIGGSRGALFDAQAKRPHVFDINASIGQGSLRVSWLYCELLHARATVENLARRYLTILRELLRQCGLSQGKDRREAEGCFDPSLTRIDPEKLERILQRVRRKGDAV
jgi:amino acid adenylation domain-containing protein/non-ribosomal peptide synthase protein (TIGR01720 family)